MENLSAISTKIDSILDKPKWTHYEEQMYTMLKSSTTKYKAPYEHYLLQEDSRQLLQIVEKLTCAYYGFECDFVTEGEIEEVIEKFKTHTDDEHGIDYSKESLMQFIVRQK